MNKGKMLLPGTRKCHFHIFKVMLSNDVIQVTQQHKYIKNSNRIRHKEVYIICS